MIVQVKAVAVTPVQTQVEFQVRVVRFLLSLEMAVRDRASLVQVLAQIL